MKTTTDHEPIAIVGIGCHFPGAQDVSTFWRLLREGKETIREIPPERFDIDSYYDPTPGLPGKIVTRRAGLVDDLDKFDPGFFGISPREASSMDPQQRLLLEVTWKAIEDAGLILDKIAEIPVGVFIGMSSSDYGDMQLRYQAPADVDTYTLSGAARSILAGRISHTFNLHGPSLAIDTACSASLVAVHQACYSLWSGESAIALAGGVNAILTPEPFNSLSMATLLSPKGRCRSFDASADGFVRGEGAGLVVLKPLAQAQIDGDSIYAVILGSAINNDGRGGTVMTPNGKAQEAVLRAAYRHAGISPGSVQYVEAHGTGTRVGDPIEALALGTVMQDGHTPQNPCIIGSVKTNIGHLESAAGIAGLIKTALCLKNRAIPASLHFEVPNTAVPWDELPLRVQTEYRDWPETDGLAMAGVSSFGISGTNVHTVLAEVPCHRVPIDQGEDANVYLLPISAHTDDALVESVRHFQQYLYDETEIASLHDICFSAGVRRNHHSHRAAFIGRSRTELISQLADFQSFGPKTSGMNHQLPETRAGVVFVFSGQGPEFWPMDAGLLLTDSPFLKTLRHCQKMFEAEGADWNLLKELSLAGKESRLHQTDVCQAAIFACQVALAAQWHAWGIEPVAIVGHSLGEIAAAHVAGALSLEQAVRVVFHRGRITATVASQGSMALVGLSMIEAARAIQGFESNVAIAANNSHSTCVLSGNLSVLEEVLEPLRAAGIFVRFLPAIDYAAHSPQMEPLKHEMIQRLSGLTPSPPSIPVYSTVTGSLASEIKFDATYWADNLRETVQFHRSLQEIINAGYTCFLEVHPQQVLFRPLQETLDRAGTEAVVFTSLQQGADGQAMLLHTLGSLWTHGCNIHWHGLYTKGGSHVNLPSIPWNRSRHWLPSNPQVKAGLSSQSPYEVRSSHPLLGWRTELAAQSQANMFQTGLNIAQLPYLADHSIEGEILFPAAGYAEIILAAANELLGPGEYVLERLSLERALFLSKETTTNLQTVVTQRGQVLSVSIYARSISADAEAIPSWTLHAEGAAHRASDNLSASQQIVVEDFKADSFGKVSGPEFYEQLAESGFLYGPLFQGIDQILQNENEVLATLNVPLAISAEATHYQIHPALLDVCFQSIAVAILHRSAGHSDDLYLPVELGRMRIIGPPDLGVYIYSKINQVEASAGERFSADIQLLDQNGHLLVDINQITFQRLGQRSVVKSSELDRYLYEIYWQRQSLPEPDRAFSLAGTWLVFTDTDGLGRQISNQILAASGVCALVRSADKRAYVFGNGLDEYRVDANRPEEMQWLLEDVTLKYGPVQGILYLWGLDAIQIDETDSGTNLLESMEPTLAGLLHIVQALAHRQSFPQPRLWIVTRNAEMVSGFDKDEIALSATPLGGFARTVALEFSELRCSTIDFGPPECDTDVLHLWQEIVLDSPESRIAYRANERHIARLDHLKSMSPVQQRPVRSDEVFRLGLTTPGSLENLLLESAELAPLEADQVEIEIHSAGLNFLDVLSALGLRPDQTGTEVSLGMECAGTVKQVGSNVSSIYVGEQVLAIAPHSFGSYTRTFAPLVITKPANLNFQQAAATPVAYLTAYYALHTLGHLEPGERILIHSAAGGVGLAAVYLAQKAGAEVIATAGSPAKRKFLLELGIKKVMDSRTLAFVEELMAYTAGEGVDIVLNSLAGEAIPASLSVLGANGRFLEIGKRDIYERTNLDMGFLKKNIAFFAIDLIPLLTEKTEFCSEVLHKITQMLAKNELPPLPVVKFPIDRAEEAFRFMAQARHIGKVVLSIEVDNQSPDSPEERYLQIRSRPRERIRANGSYLITGGLGGIGLQLVRWLVDKGARHLILLGRSVPDQETQKILTNVQRQGVQLLTFQVDVSNADDLSTVIETIQVDMPPLRGVFHLAGILNDSILMQMSKEKIHAVMTSKVVGAWLLHRYTYDMELDMFVLFSSFVSLFGSPGQANYAAANSFLDGLAHFRSHRGLPALSINWGAWGKVGMAARTAKQERRNRLEDMGVLSLNPRIGIALLESILASHVVQASGIEANWAKLFERVRTPLLEELASINELSHNGRPGNLEIDLRHQLVSLQPIEREKIVQEFLRKRIAHILRTSVDQIAIHRPLGQLGLDSLMAFELKNKLDAETGTSLPITAILQHPTIAGLSLTLIQQMDLPASELRNGVGLKPPSLDKSLRSDFFARNVSTLYSEVVLDPSIYCGTHNPLSGVNPERLFLTGATGFLGGSLLHNLLTRTSAQIYCLVRAEDAMSGLQRVIQALKLSDPQYRLDTNRISVVLGDLAQPQFGLSNSEFEQLAECIDMVFHSGASVNWLATYENLASVNVTGTHEVIRLAAYGKTAPLHYVSSIGVFPIVSDVTQAAVSEDAMLDHGGILYGGYAQSKWVAEKLVHVAHDRGLPVTIYRPSLIVGHSRFGTWRGEDFLVRMIGSWIQLGMAPDLNAPMDLVPVDFVSRSIARLALEDQRSGSNREKVYHLNNPRAITVSNMIEWLNKSGYPVRKVPYRDWRSEMLSRQLPEYSVLQAIGPLLVLPISEDINWVDHTPHFLSTNTQNALDDISCPVVDSTVFSAYITYLIDIGVLPAPVSLLK